MIRKVLILMAIMLIVPMVAEAGRWRGTITSSVYIQRARGMTCVNGQCTRTPAVTVEKEVTRTRSNPRFLFRRFYFR
jgi:hypothetical protein